MWTACLAGPLVAALALLWLDGRPLPGIPPALELPLIAAIAVAIGVSLGWWLDRGIHSRLRRLERSVTLMQSDALREPGAWGELSELMRAVEGLLARHRDALRSVETLHDLEAGLSEVRRGIERWVETERWTPLAPAAGPLAGTVEALNRGLSRHASVLEQNEEAARQVHGDLEGALANARDAAEQAEHGFIEATALLTTVRELQRLGNELTSAVTRGPARESGEAWRTAAAEAVVELTDAASRSIEQLSGGFARVREISERAQVVSNRTTLVALNTVLAAAHPESPEAVATTQAAELRELVRDVHGATDRIRELADEIERRVQSAGEQMRGVRERVAARLEELPASAAEATPPDLGRLQERFREMLQDAARKSERLSASGERASRAAELVSRKVEEQVRDLEGLVVRLSPAGATPSATPARARLVPPPAKPEREHEQPGQANSGEVAP